MRAFSAYFINHLVIHKKAFVWGPRANILHACTCYTLHKLILIRGVHWLFIKICYQTSPFQLGFKFKSNQILCLWPLFVDFFYRSKLYFIDIKSILFHYFKTNTIIVVLINKNVNLLLRKHSRFSSVMPSVEEALNEWRDSKMLAKLYAQSS